MAPPSKKKVKNKIKNKKNLNEGKNKTILSPLPKKNKTKLKTNKTNKTTSKEVIFKQAHRKFPQPNFYIKVNHVILSAVFLFCSAYT